MDVDGKDERASLDGTVLRLRHPYGSFPNP